MAEFVQQICSIKGELPGSIFKQFETYLTDNDAALKENIAIVLSLFDPCDVLQKLFKAKLIDRYKQKSQAHDILKSDDVVSIASVLKFSWFFKEIEDCGSFASDSLPSMSYCTRLKVVKQYSKHLTQQRTAENLFYLINQRYDINLAFVLLPACSEKFIRNKLPTLYVQIPSSTVSTLFSIYPDLVKEYLEFILDGLSQNKRAFRNFQINRYVCVFVKLASTDPKMFIKLFERYESYIPYMKLGRRTTKHLIKCDANSVINNFENYLRIMNIDLVRKIFTLEQIEKLQLRVFPKSLTSFFSAHESDLFIRVTEGLKREHRERLLLKNFNAVFGRVLTSDEFSPVMTLPIATLLPSEIRDPWIQASLEKVEGYDKADYISNLPTSLSIPYLKEIIENQIDVSSRANTLGCMIKSLQFHKDVDGLNEILEYFIRRFRNDDLRLREELLSKLESFKLLRSSKSETWWNSFDELIKIIKFNKEQSSFRGTIQSIYTHKIINCFKKGYAMEPYLESFFILEKSLFGDSLFELCSNTVYEGVALRYYLNAFQGVKWSGETKATCLENLFCLVCKYNEKHRKDTIEIPDWMVDEVVQLVLNFEYDSLKHNIVNAMDKDKKLKEKTYRKLFPFYINFNVLSFFLKNNPSVIIENFKTVMDKLLSQDFSSRASLFIKRSAMYTAIGLPEMLRQHCFKVLREEENDDTPYFSKVNAIQILCLLSPTEKYLTIVSPYYPKSLTIDYNDAKEPYRLQQEIGKSFKSLKNPLKALLPLKNFLGGDYLKYVVGSINSVSLNVPETSILPVLSKWMDSPVSVRKHYIRLFYKIAPKEEKCRKIKLLFQKEKNSSMRFILFQHCFSYFTNEPCDASFDILKFIVEQLTSKDSSALEVMFGLDKVPDEFVSRYMKMLWKVVSLEEGSARANYRNKVIRLTDKEVLRVLDEDFCESLLMEIFSLENIENVHLLSFVSHYLLYSNDKDVQSTRLDKTMSHIKKMIKSHWSDHNLNKFIVFPIRKVISLFVTMLCDDSRDRDSLFIDPCILLKEFKTNIKELLSEHTIFQESLNIDFAIFYHEEFVLRGSVLPSTFVAFVRTFLHKNCEINPSVLLRTAQAALPYHLLKGENHLILCEALINDPSEMCNILGVNLLSNRINDDFAVGYYKRIIKVIEEHPNTNVKICGFSVLKDLVSTVKI